MGKRLLLELDTTLVKLQVSVEQTVSVRAHNVHAHVRVRFVCEIAEMGV